MRRIRLLALILVPVAVVIAAWWFQPWRLFTVSEVQEPLPQVSAAKSETNSLERGEAGDLEAEDSSQPELLYAGELISHEHQSSGAVKVLLYPDGSRVLRFEGLQTSDGPDLEVWLSDAEVLEGPPGWYLFDDGSYASLGKLKATSGDQNYEIPPGVDLEQLRSVSIWCVRFAVSFAAAKLH